MSIIFSIIIDLAIILVFLRFVVQLLAMSKENPVVEATFKITKVLDVSDNHLAKFAQGRVNVMVLMILMVLCFFKIWGLGQLGVGVSIFDQKYYNLATDQLSLLKGTLMMVTEDLLSFCHYMMIVAIIMSFVSLIRQQVSPVAEFIQALAEPIFAPFRKILPNMGMLDLSPLLALLIFDVIEEAMKYASLAILSGIY